MEKNKEQLELLKEMLQSKKEDLEQATDNKEKEELKEEIELLENHILDLETEDIEEVEDIEEAEDIEEVEEIKQDENTKEMEVQNASLEQAQEKKRQNVGNSPTSKQKKKYIIGVIVLIIIVILPFLAILTINMSNQSTYKEVVQIATDLGYSEVKLGYIHKKDEVNEAKEELTKEKSSVDLVNSATQQIKDTVNDTATNYLTNIQKTSLDNILNNLTTNDDNTNIYYLKKANSTTTQQYQYTSVIALVDDLNYIIAQDNFKPAKSNKKIKSYVSDIDKKATKAYNEVLEALGTDNTTKELKTFITSFDFTKALTDKDIEKLKIYTGYLISPEVIEDIDNARKDIKGIKDKINTEVKAVRADEKEAKSTNKKASTSVADTSGSTNSSTASSTNSNTANSTNSNSSSNTNNTNSGGSTNTDSCGWGTDCYCKQHYASEGWTVYYPDNDDCGYPNAGQTPDWATPYPEGYDREFATAIFNAINSVRTAHGQNALPYDNTMQSCTDTDNVYNQSHGAHALTSCYGDEGVNGWWSNQIEAGGQDMGERTKGPEGYAAQIANQWYNHDAHNIIMMDDQWDAMCVSVHHNGKGSAYVTVNFKKYNDAPLA